MSARNDGGPAFPTVIPTGNVFFDQDQGINVMQTESVPGMTLRDYFAAKAPEVPDMQTFPIKQWTKLEIVDLSNGMKGQSNVLHQESWAERAARWAHEYADAMLAERAK